jgi:hypothetical protein
VGRRPVCALLMWTEPARIYPSLTASSTPLQAVEVQATSRAPIQHVPGDRPLAFLTALAIQLSWGSKSPRFKAGRRSKKPVDDDGARQNAGSVTNAQSTDHREAQDKAAEGALSELTGRFSGPVLCNFADRHPWLPDAFATEQKQITEESIALTTADDLSQDVRIMRRTLDACLLRLVQSQLVKCVWRHIRDARHTLRADSPLSLQTQTLPARL